MAVLGHRPFTVAYSVGCITRLIPWERASLAGHTVAVITLQPVVVAALWLSGGQDSYMGPMLVLPMLYVAYFFPARYAWPLAALEVLTAASPLVTAPGGEHLLLARTVSYGVAYAGLLLTIGFLKRRLVDAERQQHQMARVDPLTGLQNRRGFDEALNHALEGGTRFTLLLADVDSFKQINDRFGHTTGDRVLRELAPTPRPRSAAATAWRGSAATSSRWSPRARAPRRPSGWRTRCAPPARASTPATAPSH